MPSLVGGRNSTKSKGCVHVRESTRGNIHTETIILALMCLVLQWKNRNGKRETNGAPAIPGPQRQVDIDSSGKISSSFNWRMLVNPPTVKPMSRENCLPSFWVRSPVSSRGTHTLCRYRQMPLFSSRPIVDQSNTPLKGDSLWHWLDSEFKSYTIHDTDHENLRLQIFLIFSWCSAVADILWLSGWCIATVTHTWHRWR